MHPAQLPLLGSPTPLQSIETSKLGVGSESRLWIKRDDLTGTALSGNKLRKMAYVLSDAKACKADVLITCGDLQSNHCRATAILARQLGFEVHLVLHGRKPQVSQGNLMLEHLAGAAISYCNWRDYRALRDSGFAELVSHYARENKKAYVIPTGASNEIGLWGYVSAYTEILGQCEEKGFKPDLLVCATGSGGTHAGLVVGGALAEQGVPVLGIAVCDNEAYFRQRYSEDVTAFNQRYGYEVQGSSSNFLINDTFIGEGYGKASPDVWQVICRLAQAEGIFLDPVYTGKAFSGLLKLLEEGAISAKNIVFIHTGGLFGLLAQSEQYARYVDLRAQASS